MSSERLSKSGGISYDWSLIPREHSMRRLLTRTVAAGLVAAVANAACSHHVTISLGQTQGDDQTSIHQPTAEQRQLGIYQPYSDADIDFMTGMISHHAQAVIMASWAHSHGARSDIAILCER